MQSMTFKNPRTQTLFDSIKTFAENVPVYNLAKDLRAAGVPVSDDVRDEQMLKNEVGDLMKELDKLHAAELAAAIDELDALVATNETESELDALD